MNDAPDPVQQATRATPASGSPAHTTGPGTTSATCATSSPSRCNAEAADPPEACRGIVGRRAPGGPPPQAEQLRPCGGSGRHARCPGSCARRRRRYRASIASRTSSAAGVASETVAERRKIGGWCTRTASAEVARASSSTDRRRSSATSTRGTVCVGADDQPDVVPLLGEAHRGEAFERVEKACDVHRAILTVRRAVCGSATAAMWPSAASPSATSRARSRSRSAGRRPRWRARRRPAWRRRTP